MGVFAGYIYGKVFRVYMEMFAGYIRECLQGIYGNVRRIFIWECFRVYMGMSPETTRC